MTLILLCFPTKAQLTKRSPHPAPTGEAANSNQDELVTRLANAQAARESGQPNAVTEANTLVVASAALELAILRSAEGAFPQAADLYQISAALEPRPTTLLALATAEAQAGRYTDAIVLADRVHRSDPGNLQADRILSSSYLQKGDAASALAPLERVAAADKSVETQYALANCLLQTKRPADRARAEAIFHKVAAEHGDSGSLHVLIGRAYRDAGDLSAAVAQFQQALALDPNTPHAHYFLGLARLSQNEWRPTPEAVQEIRKETELYPRDYLAAYMTGFLLSGERRYEEAEPFLKRATALDATSPDPWLYLGLNAYAQNDMATAEADLRKAVTLTGSDEARSNFQIRRAYVDLGRILSTAGRHDEAEVFLTKAHDLQNKTMEQTQQTVAGMAGTQPGAPGVVDIAAAASVAGGTAHDETAPLNTAMLPQTAKLTAEQRAALAERELQLRGVLALAYNDLGTSEAVQGHYDAAASLYRKAEDWDSKLPGLEKNLGQSEFRAGNFEASVSPLTQALLEQPASHGLRAMLGIAYFNLNRFSEAARTFEPLGQAGMQDAEVGYPWAASLARVSDNVKASEVLKAFAAQPHPPEVQLLVGQLWTALGDYPRALETFKQALTADPNLPQARFDEGLAYLHWEHWPEAASAFESELQLRPGDPDATYHLGYVFLQEGKTNEALQLFREVAGAHPHHANAQYQVGKIELERGNTQEAINHLKWAESSSPGAAYIHYQLQAAYRKASRAQDADQELAIYKQLKADARAEAAERASVH